MRLCEGGRAGQGRVGRGCGAVVTTCARFQESSRPATVVTGHLAKRRDAILRRQRG